MRRGQEIVSRLRLPSVLLAFLVCIVLVPFLSKPFHIDDPFWVWTAKQISAHPLDFYGYLANWYGTQQWMHEITKTPPLFSYVLAVGGIVLGWNEVALHITMWPISILFALGIYRLARNVCGNPLMAAALAVLTPVFTLSGTSVMCDTMMAGLWVWSLVFWIEAYVQKRNSLWMRSAFLGGLCCLTKYNGVTLVPVLLLYSLLMERCFPSRCLYLLIPLLMVGGYRWWSQTLYGKDVILQTVSFTLSTQVFSIAALMKKTAVGLSFLGGTLAPLLFVAPFLWGRKGRVRWGGIFVAMVFVGMGASFSLRVQWALWAVVGIQFLALSLLDIVKRRDPFSWCLLAWVWGTFCFAAYLNWSVTGRAFILMAPPLGILVARRLKDVRGDVPLPSRKLSGSLMASMIFLLLLCSADAAQAQSIRRSVDFILSKYPLSQHTVWFQGHWGFQYYMELAGAKTMDFAHSEPMPGDVLVIPTNNTNLRQPAGVELVGTLHGPVASYIAIMNVAAGAGYYSDDWGSIPFRLFYRPLETVLFYRVVDPVALRRI